MQLIPLHGKILVTQKFFNKIATLKLIEHLSKNWIVLLTRVHFCRIFFIQIRYQQKDQRVDKKQTAFFFKKREKKNFSRMTVYVYIF